VDSHDFGWKIQMIKIQERMKIIKLIVVIISLANLFACDDLSTQKPGGNSETGWSINENGDSVMMRYDEQGRLTSFTTYKNGMKNGLSKKFFSTGNIEFEILYKNGLKEGITKWYYEKGALYRVTTYKDDEEEGIQKKYYESGTLMAEIPYKKGKILPGLKEYTKEGELKKRYPTLIIEPVNKLAFENKYILRCYLSDHSKFVKFFRIINDPSNDNRYMMELETKEGIAEIEYFVSEGGYVFQNELIRAEVKTSLQNIYVIETGYKVAVDN
jgi:hypothetical protein